MDSLESTYWSKMIELADVQIKSELRFRELKENALKAERKYWDDMRLNIKQS